MIEKENLNRRLHLCMWGRFYVHYKKRRKCKVIELQVCCHYGKATVRNRTVHKRKTKMRFNKA